MSAMIDCVFILLIFFIVTTTFVEETGVEVDKPQAASSVNLEKNSILLALTASGDVVYGGKNIGIQGVQQLVRRMVQKEKGDELPVVVDYWAPWCGPCRMMAPEFARPAEALKGRARFAKIDTQDHPAVSERLGIRGIPLLILWKNGRELARLSGARPAAEIAEFVKRAG